MSINVTVNGNPISINRGKMVTYDGDSEFDRRRQIRLQQVRQQSKDIAADIRNRVQKERTKQLSKAEKRGETELKRWQTRKLHNLQQQYQDGVKDIGSAHARAVLEPDPDQTLAERNKRIQDEALARGALAAEKQKTEMDEIQAQAQKPIELKKQVRKMEDTRASLVAKLRSPKKKKKRKSVTTDVTITSNVLDESETSPEEVDKQTSRSEMSLDLTPETSISEKTESSIFLDHSRNVSAQLSPKQVQELIQQHKPFPSYKETTRISDRIRQRQFSKQTVEDYEDFRFISPRKRNFCMETNKICDIRCLDLPYVPATCIRPEESSESKIVEKIRKENVRIVPELSEEMETETERIRDVKEKRNREALDRGAKALGKTKIRNDYKQLMKDLPVLQRQERLASMRTHDPTLFMSDARLREMERKRQNRIENVFEKYYKKTELLERPLVTIKPVQKTPPSEEMRLPFEVLNVTESPGELNVAEWDKPGSNREGSQEKELENKQRTLVELLERVNRQKELLLKEVATLPPDSNLEEILQGQGIRPCPCPQSKVKMFVTTGTSPLSMHRSDKPEEKKKKNETGTKRLASTSASSSDTSTEEIKKKHKRVKTKKQKCLIKNEGTQTSPLTLTSTSTTKSRSLPSSDPVTRTSKDENDTNRKPKLKSKSIDQDKLCEIIIKMAEESCVKISTCKTSEESARTKRSSVDVTSEGSIRTKRSSKVPREQPFYNDVSTSTTYFSPPEIRTVEDNFKSFLHSKPQQMNVDQVGSAGTSVKTGSKQLDSRLLKYIKKLLSMSRHGIDELTVSSVSDVSSPGPSVIDSPMNTSLVHLQNIMNRFNITLDDIQKYLVSSSDSVGADVSEDITQKTVSERPEQNDIVKSPKDDDIPKDIAPDDNSEVPYSVILSKYNEMTQNCCEKILKLAAMIDKVRLEKQKLLSSETSDKNEVSVTSYMELPAKFATEARVENGSSSESSISQEAIDQYLLTVNHSGQASNEEVKKVPDPVELLNLIEPRLNQLALSKPKPPPTLLRTAVRCEMLPHELSTIIEIDTAASSRNISQVVGQRPRSKSPEEKVPSKDTSPRLVESSSSEYTTISPEYAPSPLKKTRDIVDSVQKTTRSRDRPAHSDKSTSPEDMETILRSLGLGWAVSTLKKTQEALALSSSSSSVDSSLRKHVSFKDSSGSEISLKEVLNKQLLKRLSTSSSSQTDSIPSSDSLKLPHVSDALPSRDRSQQRTSTPVQQSKSSDSKDKSKEQLFTGDSDISSVRLQSEENLFLSIPNVSLDTNKSLSRSRTKKQ